MNDWPRDRQGARHAEDHGQRERKRDDVHDGGRVIVVDAPTVRPQHESHVEQRHGQRPEQYLGRVQGALHDLYVMPNAPMSMSEIMSGALTVVRLQWRTLFAIGMGLVGTLMAVNAVFLLLVPDSFPILSAEVAEHLRWPLALFSGNMWTSVLSVVCVYPFAAGIVVQLVRAVSGGYRFDPVPAIKHSAVRLPALMTATTLAWLSAVGGLILLTPAILLLLTATRPIILIEGDGAVDAMGRSWALMRRRFWGYFGVRIALLGMWLLTALGALVFADLFAAAVANVLGKLWSTVVGSIAVFLIMSIGSTLSPIVTSLIYLDSRMRFEGFDPRESIFLPSALRH